MKTRKILITLFSVIFATMIAVAGYACGGRTDVEFEGWTETKTVTAELGSVYAIEDLSAEGSDGNVYYYDIAVIDSKGNNVVCIDGKFEITDPDGYTIRYTLEITESDVRTRTVTVSVLDKEAPYISVTMPTGFAGSIYTIPEITVTDSSGETITPTYVVYKKADADKTPIEITNGKFIPDERGVYVIDITATDSSGNVARLPKEFGIRSAISENVLENFEDESSLLNSINGNNQEWLSEFEGRKGVVHIKAQDMEKTAYKFKFIREKEAYRHTPFDSITISMYVGKYGDFYQTDMEGESAYWTGISTGAWYDYTITEFGDWSYFFNSATSDKGAQLFWTWTRSIDVYIDEIRFAATPQIVLTSNAVEGKIQTGSKLKLDASVPTDDRLSVSLSVKDPSGEEVSLTDGGFTAEKTGKYIITAAVNSEEYPFYDTEKIFEIISVDKYIKIDDNFTEDHIGSEYVITDQHPTETKFVIPEAKLIDPFSGNVLCSVPVSGVTHNGSSVSVQDGVFLPESQGRYEISYQATYENVPYTAKSVIYVLSMDLKENELENFSLKSSAERVRYGTDGQGAGVAPVWLPEFEGRNGVIGLNDNAAESGYMFKLNMTYEEFAALEWDYIELAIYLESGSWLCYGNHIDSAMGAINASSAWENDTWTTLSIPKTAIKNVDSFMQAVTGSGAHLFWGWDLSEVYIDSVTFRSEPKQDTALKDGILGFDGIENAQYVVNETDWLSEYEGASGVGKITVANESWAALKFKLPAEEIDAIKADTAWTAMTIRLYVPNEGIAGETSITTPELYMNGYYSGGLEYGKWHNLTIPRGYFDDTVFKNLSTGGNFLERNGTRGNDSIHFYIDFISFKAREEFTDTADFDSLASLNEVYFGTDTNEYVASYEGAEGVIKGAYTDNWVGIQFRLNTTAEKLQSLNWEYVEFKMTVDFSGSRDSWDGLAENKAGWTYTEDGVWRIYKADKEGIIAQFGSLDAFYTAITAGTGDNSTSMMFTLWNMSAHGNFYFDYFKLV